MHNIRLNLLPEVVEDWVLMKPPVLKWWNRVRLQQRVTACLVISTVLAVPHVLVTESSDDLVQKPEQVERET